MAIDHWEGSRPAAGDRGEAPARQDREGVAGIHDADVPCRFPFHWSVERVQDSGLLIWRSSVDGTNMRTVR